MTDLTKKAETDLIKNIDNLRDNYKLADIEELIIEDIPLERISEKVKQKLEELKFLESLSFNKCSLVSLDNLPTLPNLVRITLDHNKLNGSEIEKLSIYKGLISLSIMDNNIEDINGFGSMQQLVQLNIFGNPIANSLKIREPLYEKLGSLVFLDNLNKSGQEIIIEADIQKKQRRSRKGVIDDEDVMDSKRKQIKQQ